MPRPRTHESADLAYAERSGRPPEWGNSGPVASRSADHAEIHVHEVGSGGASDPPGRRARRTPGASRSRRGLRRGSSSLPAPLERRRVHDGAGRVRRPVGPVRPGGEDDDVLAWPPSSGARASANSWQRPPAPRPRTVTVVSPAAIRHAGGERRAGHCGRPRRGSPRRPAPPRAPRPGGSASSRQRRDARAARASRHRRLHDERSLLPMTTFVTPVEDRIARLRRVRHLAARAGLEMRPHGGGGSRGADDAKRSQDAERVCQCARVGGRGPGGDGRRAGRRSRRK